LHFETQYTGIVPTRKENAWEPTTLFKKRDGFLLLVSLAANGQRWRYAVTPLEYVRRGPSPMRIPPPRAEQFAHARGYMKTRERALRAADVACDGLLKALREKKKGRAEAFASEHDV
jgi:hypothetical protein